MASYFDTYDPVQVQLPNFFMQEPKSFWDFKDEAIKRAYNDAAAQMQQIQSRDAKDKEVTGDIIKKRVQDEKPQDEKGILKIVNDVLGQQGDYENLLKTENSQYQLSKRQKDDKNANINEALKMGPYLPDYSQKMLAGEVGDVSNYNPYGFKTIKGKNGEVSVVGPDGTLNTIRDGSAGASKPNYKVVMKDGVKTFVDTNSPEFQSGLASGKITPPPSQLEALLAPPPGQGAQVPSSSDGNGLLEKGKRVLEGILGSTPDATPRQGRAPEIITDRTTGKRYIKDAANKKLIEIR